MLAHLDLGAGDPVTLLHGFTQSGESWRELAGLLGPGPRPLRLILPDLPGHGGSAAETATVEAAGNALLDLWDALDIGRSHLVGYSLGGRVALHLAARRPERLRTLATVGAHAGIEDPAGRAARRAADEELAASIERDGLAAFLDRWEAMPMWAGLAARGPEFLARLRAIRASNTAAGLAASLRGMGPAATPAFWDRLPAITVPVLALAGERDPVHIAHAARIARLVPRGSSATLAGAGHAAHLERPEEVARLLGRHLAAS